MDKRVASMISPPPPDLLTNYELRGEVMATGWMDLDLFGLKASDPPSPNPRGMRFNYVVNYYLVSIIHQLVTTEMAPQ